MSRKLTTQEFIEIAKLVYGNKLDYSKVDYKGNKVKVTVIYPKHGEWSLRPNDHLSRLDCPKCNLSKGKYMIEKYLKDHNLQYISQKECYLDVNIRKTNKLVLDFVVFFKNRPYIIEYNGEQHYKYIPHFHESEEDFELQKRRDELLRKRCLHRGFPLIEIPYTIKTEEEVTKVLNSYFSDSPTYLYTDGAFSKKRNSGGWGVVEVKNDHILYYDSNKVSNTTNNRMELFAVIKALYHCLKQHINNCIIFSDSSYVIGCGTQNWVRKKNLDLWEVFDKLMNKIKNRNYNIEFKHVKGHQKGESLSDSAKYNNLADELAVRASLRL